MAYDVTIGIPVYNASSYIKRTMESVLSQSYPSIEFLLVDDGSEDDTFSSLNTLKTTHPRGKDIRIVRFSNNKGVSEARNCIITEAQGEYLYFMDADDVIREDTVSLMMQHARDFSADAVFGSMEKVSPAGEKILYQYPKVRFSEEDAFACFAYRRYAGIQASACNFLVRLSLLRKNNLHFYPSNYWEDFVFVLDLVTFVQRAVLLSDITYTYLCRPNSLSNFQERDHIAKSEIFRNVSVADYMKKGSRCLAGKPYYPQRCYVAVMTDFYIACHVLKRRRDIRPHVSNREIRDFFSHPASWREILYFRQARMKNMALYLLGKLPPYLCIAFIWMAGKTKQLV